MNTNDLYLEYARVIKMCEGTELEDTPWRIIQWRNIPNGASKWECFTTHPDFGRLDPQTEVRFAVAVLEGRPVFVGDTLWIKDGHGFTVEDDLHIDHRIMSWTPPTPKRTFTLNGKELPCPKPKFKEGTDWTFDISGDLFGFDTKEECDSVYQAIIKLLTEARDNP